jgi:hypothetical protein
MQGSGPLSPLWDAVAQLQRVRSCSSIEFIDDAF